MTASLDVEPIFNTVPMNSTIEIIINQVYNHSNLPSVKLPQNTKRATTFMYKGTTIQKTDGVYIQTEFLCAHH